jgi:CBS domain-containing protein
VTVSHAFTVLTLRRSILTEKVARRGYHLSREYAIDPLEILFVREVMRTSVAALPAGARSEDLSATIRDGHPPGRQRLYPVVDDQRKVVGVVTRNDLQRSLENPAIASTSSAQSDAGAPLASLVRTATVAYPDESLRVVVYRMAETGLTRFPVVSRDGTLVGMIALTDLLKARALNLDAERRRERVLATRIGVAFNSRRKTA